MTIITLVVVVAVGLLAAIVVPIHASSSEIQVAPTGTTHLALSLPASSWVSVRFAHPGDMPMRFEMGGPGGGMMFDHQGMMNGDSDSFWSGGGTYDCWVGYSGMGATVGTTPVWVNVTWGLL